MMYDSNDESTPYNKTKKQTNKKTNNLLKTKSKKKKLYNELTFVENHVDTFYIGLNSPSKAVCNPKQAVIVDMTEADQITKDWV